MSNRVRSYSRTTVLRQRVEALASQLNELENLRAQVLRAEERAFGSRQRNRAKVVAGTALAGRRRRKR
jgi:hypothetical protein